MKNKNIYELRIYTIKPEGLPKLLKLWENEGNALIEKYMKCVGVWNSESGVLNKIFHMYFWENYKTRELARKNFYNDKNAKEYIKKVKPFYQKQESYLLSCADFSKIQLK